MAYETDYAQSYDDFNRGKDYVNEVNFLESIFKKFDKTPKKILDLGCGTGLHDVILKQKGYEVTGLDLSRGMINLASNRGDSIKYSVGDMSDFHLEEKFDVIICMFSSLGYLTENNQLEGFFKCCKEHLNPDGLLILDIWNGDSVIKLKPEQREKVIEEDDLRIVRISYPDLDEEKHVNNVKFEVKVFEFDDKLIDEYEEEHKVRYFFLEEIKEYMKVEGFEMIHNCPSFDLDKEVSDDDWNMMVVGKLG